MQGKERLNLYDLLCCICYKCYMENHPKYKISLFPDNKKLLPVSQLKAVIIKECMKNLLVIVKVQFRLFGVFSIEVLLMCSVAIRLLCTFKVDAVALAKHIVIEAVRPLHR